MSGSNAGWQDCPELKERMQKEGHLAMEQILEVQMQGDDEVNAIIDQAIGYLGIALANVVNLINPGYVVADSCLFSVEKNRQRLLEAAKGNFFGLNEEEVQIVFTPFDRFRGAKGAGYFLIRELFHECLSLLIKRFKQILTKMNAHICQVCQLINMSIFV